MKIIPQNKMVLCTQASSSTRETTSGLIYTVEEVPLYKIEAIGPGVGLDAGFSVGDVVRVNSTGTLAKDMDEEHWLFSIDNIVGKVIL